MGLKIGGNVEKVNGKKLSYGEFVKNYVEKNQPVVLTGLMDDWRACTDWVSPNGHPNLHFFSTHFGKSLAQVADCCTREFTDQKRVEMSVSEFIDHWAEDSGEVHTSANGHKSLLYLKDWHFVKEYPKYLAYTTPTFFCDDWLNLYLDHYRMHTDLNAYQENNEISCSDYRFVYMGAKGTWTPLHADVFRSYSWSANVCGKKQWHFLSPSQYHLVFDRNMKTCVYNIFEDVTETKFPGFRKAIWLECTQEENEIIFVPSGWYHQVHNLEDTISINHNWFKAHNLSWVWDLLLRDYDEAKGYIEDIKDICDDFEGLCQRNLAANTGMNFYDFFIFIARFCFANLVQLCYILKDLEISAWSSSPLAQHLASNLVCMRKTALKMKSVEAFARNGGFTLDFREILGSLEFHELCLDLGKTYGTIHEQTERFYNTKNALVDELRNFNFIRSATSQIEGPVSPAEMVEILQGTLEEQGRAFGSSRAKEEEKRRVDRRRLQEEQDAAYLAALKIDTEKERLRISPSAEAVHGSVETPSTSKKNPVRKEELPKVKVAATRETQKSKEKANEGKGPKDTQILLRFPNGDRRELSFSRTDKIRSVYECIDSLGLLGVGTYRLISSFPRRVFGADQMGMTLKDAGLHPRASLFLELL